MAAIGFKLRARVRPNTVLGWVRAYAYAGLAGAGPWICSAMGIVLVGVLSLPSESTNKAISGFEVSTTYMIAASLILTGPWQFALTRFISDRLYDKRVGMILPNFTGAALIVTLIAIAIGAALIAWLLRDESRVYQATLLAGFVVECNIWLAVAFLSGLRRYGVVLFAFVVGYGLSAVAAIALQRFHVEGLVLGFTIGQGVLLAISLSAIYYSGFWSGKPIALDFLKKEYRYPSLMLLGLLYYLATWVDKLMFWYTPGTGHPVLGQLHASLIYDTPVFLSYVVILPAMAAFLLRMETEFAPHYKSFYGAVLEGASLEQIEIARNGMVEALRGALFDIIKVESVTALIFFASAPALLKKLGMSTLYLPLLYVDVVAAALQMLLLITISGLLYLDRRKSVVTLIVIFAALNATLTAYTLTCSPLFYGYGFAVALLLSVLIGVWTLNRRLEFLEYETYMLQ
jgi:uncharacterized membrane protein